MAGLVECPNHSGNFDCTPFCDVCQGNQEFDANGTLPCTVCGTDVDALTRIEELGFCIPCQHAYFDNELETN